MNKDDLKKLLEEYLSIEIEEESSYGTKSISVKIKFDNEEISSDSYYINRCLD